MMVALAWEIVVTKGDYAPLPGVEMQYRAVLDDNPPLLGFGHSFSEAVDDLLERMNDEVSDDEICPPINWR